MVKSSKREMHAQAPVPAASHERKRRKRRQEEEEEPAREAQKISICTEQPNRI